MLKQVLIIHGGDTFDTYEDYLSYLKKININLDRIRAKSWKDNLGQILGSEYDVLNPQMPNKLNAKYIEWKILFEKLIPQLNDEVVLVGHSLGGIFLAKYLSENDFPKKIKATFLIAAPHAADENDSLGDFNLLDDLSKFSEQGGEIFLYHSKDDPVVTFPNLSSYEKALPNAHVKIFEDRQHFYQTDFPELAEEIIKVYKS